MSELIEGKCHCGDVTWQAELPADMVLNCYCNICRSLSGADYSSWVIFADEKFKLLTGKDKIVSYAATESFIKHFCSRCAASIFLVNNAKFPGFTYVARGNITTDIDLKIQMQVFTDDKAAWIEPDPDLPVFNP